VADQKASQIRLKPEDVVIDQQGRIIITNSDLAEKFGASLMSLKGGRQLDPSTAALVDINFFCLPV
jgi:hypothetical protein